MLVNHVLARPCIELLLFSRLLLNFLNGIHCLTGVERTFLSNECLCVLRRVDLELFRQIVDFVPLLFYYSCSVHGLFALHIPKVLVNHVDVQIQFLAQLLLQRAIDLSLIFTVGFFQHLDLEPCFTLPLHGRSLLDYFLPVGWILLFLRLLVPFSLKSLWVALTPSQTEGFDNLISIFLAG